MSTNCVLKKKQLPYPSISIHKELKIDVTFHPSSGCQLMWYPNCVTKVQSVSSVIVTTVKMNIVPSIHFLSRGWGRGMFITGCRGESEQPGPRKVMDLLEPWLSVLTHPCTKNRGHKRTGLEKQTHPKGTPSEQYSCGFLEILWDVMLVVTEQRLWLTSLMLFWITQFFQTSASSSKI